jgi:uncharacterized protein (TIGR02466 family)
MEIYGVFSHPIVVIELPKLEESIHNYFKKEEYDKVPNISNKMSENDRVLENKICQPLKERLTQSISQFTQKILSSDCDLYITQSWLNFTEKGGAHHKHYHPNSIISGVFYYDVSLEDNISFSNPFKFQYDFTPNQYNIFNSPEWTIPTKSNTVVLFMSYMSHFVKEKQEGDVRKTLAFNTFFKPPFGLKNNRTLII